MLYEFRTDFRITPSATMPAPGPGQFPTATEQLSHVQRGRTEILTGKKFADPSDTEDFLEPGFHALDEGMKMYWSGMRVPTKDSYRFCRIKIAGGDKSLLVWRDDLLNGRARLPVASLNRGKHEFNKDRFSPAYLPMAIRFVNKRGDRAALVYRPVPWLVDYTCSIWAEHKRDVEYVFFQILRRFNPLAVFKISDGHLQGDITLRYGGANDQSDKEVQFDQQPYLKYEIQMTAEAWLPLPERVLPTVMGTVVNMKDDLANTLQTLVGQQNF